MPKNYSVDLRWRAVWLFLIRMMSYAEIADLLFMAQRSVRRYADLYLLTGEVEPKKQRHELERLLNEFEQTTVLQTMIDRPGVYLTELQRTACAGTA